MIYVLSLYVLGMVMVQHCGQTQIATFLSGLLGCKVGSMKQRLRELTYEADSKRGQKRQSLDVSSCFAALLGWVLSKFKGENRQLVLAMDATYLKDRFVILAVSVVVAGCAIPVAWHIQEGTRQGAWNPIWLKLLGHLQDAIPPDWTVFVLTDSGLYSKTLYQALTGHFKWHVLMRIANTNGLFRADQTGRWVAIRDLIRRGTPLFCLTGTCFKAKPLACTLILQWDEQYDHPCLILTNLPPNHIQHNLYALRYWIECGFKDIKRGLLHWEQTKMTAPHRAERLWLVISISLLWLTALGDHALTLPAWDSLRRARSHARILSAPLLGKIVLLITLLNRQPLDYGAFSPYPWLPIPDH